MSFEISFTTNPRFIVGMPVPDPEPDPLDRIRELLGDVTDELGCPKCCSGFPTMFVKESAEFGSGTIIGNGYKLERLTKINDHLSLAEGANGGVINIGRLAAGETVPAEAVEARTSAALVVGSKEVMHDMEALQTQLAKLAESPRWRENSRSFAAIGFAEFPLVLRTNDPLIT